MTVAGFAMIWDAMIGEPLLEVAFAQLAVLTRRNNTHLVDGITTAGWQEYFRAYKIIAGG